MTKKILVSLFILAILLIGGGAYLIYFGTNQKETKMEEKKGYVRNPRLGVGTDYEKENFDKQTPEVQDKVMFIRETYKSKIPNDDIFGSRVDVLKECAINYLDLSKESRRMAIESLGEEVIIIPECDVDGILQGIELSSDQREYIDILKQNFDAYSQQQNVYEETAKEYGGADQGGRPELQEDLDNIEYRLSYIEDGMAELFNKFFPYL